MDANPRPLKPWVELRVMRTKDGHSQSSLCKLTGFSKSYMSELESGRRRPNPRVIKIISRALNVPVSMLEPRVGGAEEVA